MVEYVIALCVILCVCLCPYGHTHVHCKVLNLPVPIYLYIKLSWSAANCFVLTLCVCVLAVWLYYYVGLYYWWGLTLKIWINQMEHWLTLPNPFNLIPSASSVPLTKSRAVWRSGVSTVASVSPKKRGRAVIYVQKTYKVTNMAFMCVVSHMCNWIDQIMANVLQCAINCQWCTWLS